MLAILLLLAPGVDAHARSPFTDDRSPVASLEEQDSQPRQPGDEAFHRAVAAQMAGDLEAAAGAYREFLAIYPDNVEARSNLGVVLARLGRYSEAIDAYRQALAVNPSQTAVRLNLGIALYKAADLREAARELALVLEAQPGNLQARYLQADCYLRLGEPEQTVVLLEGLEAERPDDRMLAYLLGMAYLQTKREDRGQKLIDRILRDGESAEARMLLGLAKRGIRDMPGALEDFERAVALNPDLPTVHSLYGRTLLEAGNRDRAKDAFREELARNPVDFDANLYFGVILKEEHELEAARRHFDVALGVRPGDLATRYQIASLEVMKGETESAREWLEAIVAEAPDFLEAHVSLATVYYRLKRLEEAKRERAIVNELTRAMQEEQRKAAPPVPGAQDGAATTPPPR